MEDEREVIEIVFFGPHNMHNEWAASQLAEKLQAKGKKFALRIFSKLSDIGHHVKKMSPSFGLISYYNDQKGIMTNGVDLIYEHNLFIIAVERLNFNLPPNSQMMPSFKDFFIVSSELIQKIPKDPGEEWKTLIVAEKLGGKLFHFPEVIDIPPYLNLKVKGNRVYLEIKGHFSTIGDKLQTFNEFFTTTKILGSYEVPK
jgi:prephenate dehydratase